MIGESVSYTCSPNTVISAFSLHHLSSANYTQEDLGCTLILWQKLRHTHHNHSYHIKAKRVASWLNQEANLLLNFKLSVLLSTRLSYIRMVFSLTLEATTQWLLLTWKTCTIYFPVEECKKLAVLRALPSKYMFGLSLLFKNLHCSIHNSLIYPLCFRF